MTTGRTNDVCHLVLRKDIAGFDLLLEKPCAEVNFLLNSATIDLDLLDVGLLLSNLHLADLCVADCTNHLTVFFRPLDLCSHGGIRSLAGLAPPLLVLGECLLLGLVPCLVESALDFFVQVTSPDRCQGTKTTGCFNVADEADNNHGR